MTLDLNVLAGQAEVVLRQHVDPGLSLVDPVLLKDVTRSFVVRCRVELPQTTAAPLPSVIIKYVRDDARGFSDWASLAFLDGLPATHGLAPRFFGGDIEKRLFVLEDLGGSQSLDDLLRQPDAQRAMAVFRGLAICMARLQAATFGKEARFVALRQTLPSAVDGSRHDEAVRWLENQAKVRAWFQAADCALPDGFDACVQAIAQVYTEPGPFLCFSHGDPAPSNNHVAGERVRLLDFEYGAFRHALYDLTGWNILCPLPDPCVQEMNRCFRRTLAKACPPVQEDDEYALAWATMCAFRALAILTWIPPTVLQENRPWVDAQWTSRHAVLAALSRLYDATAGVTQLAPVHEAAAKLNTALHQRWPEFNKRQHLIPSWPAFATICRD
ncbi:MAG: hypothetical protein U0350_49750 [Caldilineaceae bacterium]